MNGNEDIAGAGDSGHNSEASFPSELPGEKAVHPYMSLYENLLYPNACSDDNTEEELEGTSTVGSESPEEVPSNGIRTSVLQKHPVQYATRIYRVVSPMASRKGASGNTAKSIAKETLERMSPDQIFSSIDLSLLGDNKSKKTKTYDRVVPDEAPSAFVTESRTVAESSHNPSTPRNTNRRSPMENDDRAYHQQRTETRRHPRRGRAHRISEEDSGHDRRRSSPECSNLHRRSTRRRISSSWIFVKEESDPENANDGAQRRESLAKKRKTTNSEPSKRHSRPTSSYDSGNSSESSAENWDEESNDEGDPRIPATSAKLAKGRFSKRQRIIPQWHTPSDPDKRSPEASKKTNDDEEKSIELVKSLSRRYPKRKKTSIFLSSSDDEKEYYPDNDTDGIDEDEDKELNSDYDCRSSDSDSVNDEVKPKVATNNQTRRKKYKQRHPSEVYPNGRYPGIDYDALVRDCDNEDYSKDVVTDNGACHDKQWNCSFRELLAYVRKHKTFHIGKKSKHQNLHLWIATQRYNYKMKLMHPDRFRRLESIGFVWCAADGPTWMDVYQRLLDYKEEFGHVNVPKRYASDPALGQWCYFQRAIYNHQRRYKMTRERIDLLESVGFKWCVKTSSWMKMFDKLKEFKKKHGHFDVPHDFPDYLGLWAKLRREEYQRNTLPEDQYELLNVIGFDWKLENKVKTENDHVQGLPIGEI